MAQDIRELFKNDRGIPKNRLTEDHQKRFEARLEAHFGKEQKITQTNLWLKIAAVLIVVAAVGGLLLNDRLVSKNAEVSTDAVVVNQEKKPEIQLSDLSPQFKKVENYYLASINVELAQLEVNDVNKDLIDSFMTQMEELNTEYQKLNKDLVEIGINDQTVSALIDNLKFRLDLLYKLKQKLKEIKQSPAKDSASSRI